ncbi:MAG: DUF2807 domain-containing protein [Flavobacteriales bacterium]|nr:DUF2807 domain-containing protein [Flavobacteriales bacterium]
MKTLLISLSILFSLLLLSTSCGFIGNSLEGQGPIVTKEVSLGSINAIELHSTARVYIRQSDIQSISIKAQQNIIDLLKTEVNDGKWIIDFKRCPKTDQKIEIYIDISKLTEAEIDGSGEIISKGLIKGDDLELNIEGSGSIKFELDVKELATEINGSGDLTLSGESKLHDIEINGSGDISAYDLMTNETKVEINGSGDVKVNVDYSLDVEINGSGDVYYTGSVKMINSEINGSGKLHRQ